MSKSIHLGVSNKALHAVLSRSAYQFIVGNCVEDIVHFSSEYLAIHRECLVTNLLNKIKNARGNKNPSAF